MKLSLEEFEKLTKDAFNNIPVQFREKLENIEIVVNDRAKINPFKDKKLNLRRLLGLYRGVPLRRRGIFYSNVLPDKIILYKDNIESHCETRQELKERIEEVLLHELGHYFGLSEKQLREIEREMS